MKITSVEKFENVGFIISFTYVSALLFFVLNWPHSLGLLL